MAVDKVVILWAGCGRRISSEYDGIHKAMIPLNGKPLMEYLLANIRKAGAKEIVPILGYKAEEMKEKITAISGGWFDKIDFVISEKYAETNNLYSLVQASDILSGKDFVVVNGDMVFDYRILSDIMKCEGNAIATDGNDYGYQLDSPRILIKNDRIYDIGRHMTIEQAQGYAVGIYKFGAEFSPIYFEKGRELSTKKPSAGYHEPMEPMFDEIIVKPSYTKGYLWMDVDEKADVARAEEMLRKLGN